jgi:hypothetical protein
VGTDIEADGSASALLGWFRESGCIKGRGSHDTEKGCAIMDKSFIIAAFAGVIVAMVFLLIGMTVMSAQFSGIGFRTFMAQKNMDCHTCLTSHGLNSTVNDSMTINDSMMMYGMIDKSYDKKLYDDCNFNCTIVLENVQT